MFFLGALSPIGFLVGLSTNDYSNKSSGYLLSKPVLNLGPNPDNRTGTQSNLLRKITFIHHSIDRRFRQTSDFFNLRQAKKLRLIKYERQKAKEKVWTFLLFVLLGGEPGWECLVSFLDNALAGLCLFDLYRSGRCVPFISMK